MRLHPQMFQGKRSIHGWRGFPLSVFWLQNEFHQAQWMLPLGASRSKFRNPGSYRALNTWCCFAVAALRRRHDKNLKLKTYHHDTCSCSTSPIQPDWHMWLSLFSPLGIKRFRKKTDRWSPLLPRKIPLCDMRLDRRLLTNWGPDISVVFLRKQKMHNRRSLSLIYKICLILCDEPLPETGLPHGSMRKLGPQHEAIKVLTAPYALLRSWYTQPLFNDIAV